ncbi:MAG: hypothetical protein ACI9BD_001241, partial [Candidatus Marinamargulisbacteria bacterium]
MKTTAAIYSQHLARPRQTEPARLETHISHLAKRDTLFLNQKKIDAFKNP